MKKSALTIALLSSLVLGAYADSQTFYGGKSRTTVSGTTAATDITLDSSGGDLYASANIAAHTVNIINGNAGFANSVDWKADRGLTIDINSDDESVDAFTGTGGWSQNLYTTTIKNTGGSAAANINLAYIRLTANSGQDTTFKFNNIDAVVTTTALSEFGVNGVATTKTNRAYFYVDSGSNVEWNGNINVSTAAVLNIAGTFTHKGAMTFSGDAVSTLNITGELVFDHTAGQTINTSFNLAGRISQTSASADNGITLGRTSVIENGGHLQAHSKIILNTNSSTTVENGGVIEVAKDPSNNARVLFQNNASLTLNDADCLITSGTAEAMKLATFAGANASLYVNADQTFSTMYSNAGVFSIYMGDGVSITMELVSQSLSGTGTFSIYNFQEDSFYVGLNEDRKAYIETAVSLYDADEQFLGMATVNGAGFIALAAIPEPATWAALLGAIALGFAAYRRRK